MSRMDAGGELFQEMTIRGVKGIYIDLRIARESVPNNKNGEKLFFYELRDDCSDGVPCQYKAGILVDFRGTFISKEPLPDDDNCFFEESEFSYSNNYLTVDDYVFME